MKSRASVILAAEVALAALIITALTAMPRKSHAIEERSYVDSVRY